ncbi:hypothetical protein [Aeromonas schubertii]|uniref:hypothetical protein n=1 Tax=Aeromonas schubertii TaxID=652 RepID=UPI0010A88C10|nr:hypothetical protein [Aeromonas schubertii]QCG48870.1 hypothetical protein E2P79_14450 [Aeromonas schubertii]
MSEAADAHGTTPQGGGQSKPDGQSLTRVRDGKMTGRTDSNMGYLSLYIFQFIYAPAGTFLVESALNNQHY